METKFKLLTWNIEDNCIYSREFRTEDQAIEMALALENRKVYTHNLVGILETRKTGHRWELAVWPAERPSKIEYVYCYSKEDAKFATKLIKNYDDTIEVKLTKAY